MLSQNELKRLLERSQSPLVPPKKATAHQSCRWLLTLQVLEHLPDHIDETGLVSANSVIIITKRLYEDYRALREGHKRAEFMPFTRRIETIMSALNAIPELTVLLPVHPQPAHRSTTAPTSWDAMQQTDAVRQLDQHLERWRKQSDHPDRWLLECAVRLSCRVGLSPSVLLGTLVMLRPDHYKDGVLALPVQKTRKFTDATSEEYAQDPCLTYPLPVPSACHPALKHCCRTAKGYQHQWLFSPSPKASVPKQFDTRENKIKARLNEAFAVLKRYLLEHYPEKKRLWHQLSSFNTLARRGPFMAQQKGVPSLWLTVVAQYPLPTCTDEPLLLNSNSASFAPAQPNARKERISEASYSQHNIPDDRCTMSPGVALDDLVPAELPPEEASRLNKVLRQFVTQLTTRFDNRVNGKSNADILKALLDQSLAEAEKITGNQTSYPQMLMRFAYSRLLKEGDTIRSVETYLGRLTPSPVVFHEEAVDMLGWDQDSIDELESLAKLYPRWKDNTFGHFLRTLSMFIRFCQDMEVLDDSITSRSPGAPNIISTLRTSVPNPTLMDNAWRKLVGDTAQPSQTHQQMALALALGYYGGLRASEVCQLTLADIRIEAPVTPGWETLYRRYGQRYQNDEPLPSQMQCWIYIQRGKTPAARRRIPLHVLAPPEVIRQMQQWCAIRQAIAPREGYRRIALFGPLFSPHAYTRQGLIDPLIAWLREQWGSAIDFHTLRHAAVSWLQLRLHAAQHLDFRDRLAHRHHWMFSQKALQELYRYLCGAEGEDAVLRGSQVGHIAKLIGHRQVATSIHTYSHTLPLIHGDVLHRVWSKKPLKA